MRQLKSTERMAPLDVENNPHDSIGKPFVHGARVFPYADGSKTEGLESLRRRIIALGFSTGQIDSLGVIPVIETAEDDGILPKTKKEIVWEMMKNLRLLTTGIDPKLDELWKSFRFRTSFLIVWTVYLRDLCRGMPYDDKVVFKECVLDLCKFMNNTVGGLINLPDMEDRLLISIESAFA